MRRLLDWIARGIVILLIWPAQIDGSPPYPSRDLDEDERS